MYGCIDRGYGILMRDEGGTYLNDSNLPMLKEIVVLEGEHKSEEISDWSLDNCLDYIEESSYCWSAYSGAGEAPIALGISEIGFAYWNLQGEDGIIKYAKIEGPTDRELELWNSKVPKDVRGVISKHGFEPKVFWTSSTS